MAHPWELGDHEQRWKGYLHPVYNLTLRTKLGVMQTPEELRAAEGDFVERRLLTLRAHGLPGAYDLDGLRGVHRHLFQDVYEWAGDPRTVSMGRGGQAFAHFDDIPVFVGEVAGVVRDTDMLQAVPETQFPESLAMVITG